jgi:hypothetical protein
MPIFNIEKKTYTNEYNKESDTYTSNNFKSRPLKHWRKVACSTTRCNVLTQEVFKNKTNECGDCDPKKFIIKSGLTEKLINPINNEPAKIKYNYSHLTYLKSKCRTYNQLLSGNIVDKNDITKRSAQQCATGCQSGKPVHFTFNPSNKEFKQQGAVSASSRIHKLKYDTVTNGAATFKSAYGASAQNAGSYKTYGNTPYFVKSKIDNSCSNRPLMKYRQKKTVC